MFSRLSNLLTNDIAIDLGTANTLVYIKGKGIVLNQPSVVALDKSTNKVYAVGSEAKAMLGKTPDNIHAIRPLKDGVIADFEVTEYMLREFIRMAQKKRHFIAPRIVICVPSGITEVEKRAVRDSAKHAGAREVFLVAEPIAAAIGVGLPVDQPSGNMIIDIGGGTTEIAVIALNGIVCDTSIRVGGDEMDEAIVNYIKKNHNLLIGDQTAEHIKKTVGSAFKLKQEEEMEIKGLDQVTGIPKLQKISTLEIREALQEPIQAIVDALKHALEQTPPELAADIKDRGIVMTGGGAMLRGLSELLREHTDLPINLMDDPLLCVVHGTGRILDDFEKYRPVIMKSAKDQSRARRPQSRAMERLALGVCAFSALALLALPLNQKTAVADVLSRVLTSPWTRTVRFAEGLVDLRGENARLHAQVRAMEVDAAAADRLRRERDRLRRALGFADQDPARLVPCEVERLQVDPTATLVKIHAPEPVAWREHQPVMTDAGLVGRVVRAVAPNAAWVELITSPGFAVCCQVERTGLAGILRPQGGVFELTMVGRDEDIVATDLLITSDLPTQAGGDAEAIPSMPRGLPVARVSRVGLHKWKLFKSVTVEPLADLSELDIVFVVLGRGDGLEADAPAAETTPEAAP